MLPNHHDFCVEQAVRTGSGPQGEINLHSEHFEPQRTTFTPIYAGLSDFRSCTIPIVGEGEVLVRWGPRGRRLKNPKRRAWCVWKRNPPEQDAGKSIHDWTRHVLCGLKPSRVRADGNRQQARLRGRRGCCLSDQAASDLAVSWYVQWRQHRARMRADVNVCDLPAWQLRKYQANAGL